MALQSQMTRVEEGILQRISPDTLTSEQMRALMYAVIQEEMSRYVSEAYGCEDIRLSFREVDGDVTAWRVQTNVAFSDALTVVDALSSGVLETLPLDYTGRQLGFLKLTRDVEDDGGTFYWDVCLNADSEEEEAGFYLTGDRSVPLDWDTLTVVDQYVTGKVVLRFTLTGSMKVYGVRVQLAMVGSVARLANDVEAIANFSVARWYEQRVNKAINANAHPDTIRILTQRAAAFRSQALGVLGLGGAARAVGGGAGKLVAGDRPANPWSKKLTGRA